MRFTIAMVLLAAGCGGVSSDEEAERAYLGLDGGLVKSLNLGMAGYNAASSANIDDQVGEGDISGTITVGGQVDQGSSDNKGLRLELTFVDYADEMDLDDDGDADEYAVTFDTLEGDLPQLDLSLRNIPDGTLEGTLVGTFDMSGDLEGEVLLDLDIAADIEEDPTVADDLRRVEGTTTITGTATSDYGVFDVDLTR